MNPIIYLSVLALLVCNVYGRAIDEPDNAIGGGSAGAATAFVENNEWVKIKPIKIRPHSGNMVELECDAIGSPPPSIHWVRGGKAIDNLDLETNALSESSNLGPSSRARAISRLVVERSAVSEKEFTCVGRSGSKSEYVSTKVAPSDVNSITDMFALNGVGSAHASKKARILSFYRTIFAPIGKTVILPCKATGRPNAEVFWLDAEQNVIDGQNARQKVLQSGDLLITPLRWSDMGTYTCIARNPISKDTAETFLYPSND